MSIITPTSYGQAQYNSASYNVSVIPVHGFQALFDNCSPTDNINGNQGLDLAEFLKITEWFQGKILKPSIWSNPTGSSAGWTKPAPSSNHIPWTNADAPNQVP